MRLPEGILRQRFESGLHRGAIIRFEAADLDDPNITVKFKYALVLSVNCTESSTLYTFTTSQLGFFRDHPHLATDVLKIRAGSYTWCSLDTAINLRDVRSIARDQLLERTLEGKLTFEGDLSAADLANVDEILKQSKLIQPKILARILPKV